MNSLSPRNPPRVPADESTAIEKSTAACAGNQYASVASSDLALAPNADDDIPSKTGCATARQPLDPEGDVKNQSIETTQNSHVNAINNESITTSMWRLGDDPSKLPDDFMPHGDHLDYVLNWKPLDERYQGFVQLGEQSKSKDQLYEDPSVRLNINRLARLEPGTVRDLVVKLGCGLAQCNRYIPLFEDPSGDEYQLSLGKRTLRTVECNKTRWYSETHDTEPFFRLEARVPLDPTAKHDPEIPTRIVELGSLEIRTSYHTNETRTERTDYGVVVDIDSPDMPLWILASRKGLQMRANGSGASASMPPPIFNGLMSDNDCSYDAACILSSIHQLGNRDPKLNESIYGEACNLVGKTRAVIDPTAFLLPRMENPMNKRRHGDHWDKVEFDFDGRVEYDEDYFQTPPTFKNQLNQEPETKDWQQKFSLMCRNSLVELVEARNRAGSTWRTIRLPLFEAENGDEYQVVISSDSDYPRLPIISCPYIDENPFLEIVPGESQDKTAIPLNIPKVALHLGALEVTTSTRYPKVTRVQTVTELTDYDVMVDLGNDKMPVWIFASNWQLDDRKFVADNFLWPNYALPIFNGLMENSDCGYDSACILTSIRQLGAEGGRPSFEDACEMVRKTRAVLDPMALQLSANDNATKFAGDKPPAIDLKGASGHETSVKQEDTSFSDTYAAEDCTAATPSDGPPPTTLSRSLGDDSISVTNAANSRSVEKPQNYSLKVAANEVPQTTNVAPDQRAAAKHHDQERSARVSWGSKQFFSHIKQFLSR